MRNYLATLKKNSGFTLIELLVVIGILGVLAAALIATIDPFEQIKKSQDANIKNAVVEYANANIRYYTTHNFLPWNASPTIANCTVPVAVGGTLPTIGSTNLVGCLNALIGEGELKGGFTDVTAITNGVLVSGTAGVNAATVCFQPQSKSQRKDPNTKFTAAGVATAACPNMTADVATCYWCTY